MWIIAALTVIGLLALWDFVFFPRWERKQRAAWNKKVGGITIKDGMVWINAGPTKEIHRLTR